MMIISDNVYYSIHCCCFCFDLHSYFAAKRVVVLLIVLCFRCQVSKIMRDYII